MTLPAAQDGEFFRPIDEWRELARSASIRSPDQLNAVLYRTLDVLKTVISFPCTEQVIKTPIDSLQHELLKAEAQDSNKSDDIRQLVYGLCQSVIASIESITARTTATLNDNDVFIPSLNSIILRDRSMSRRASSVVASPQVLTATSLPIDAENHAPQLDISMRRRSMRSTPSNTLTRVTHSTIRVLNQLVNKQRSIDKRRASAPIREKGEVSTNSVVKTKEGLDSTPAMNTRSSLSIDRSRNVSGKKSIINKPPAHSTPRKVETPLTRQKTLPADSNLDFDSFDASSEEQFDPLETVSLHSYGSMPALFPEQSSIEPKSTVEQTIDEVVARLKSRGKGRSKSVAHTTTGGSTEMECPICKEKQETARKLLSHMTRKHKKSLNSVGSTIRCGCDAELSDFSLLQAHFEGGSECTRDTLRLVQKRQLPKTKDDKAEEESIAKRTRRSGTVVPMIRSSGDVVETSMECSECPKKFVNPHTFKSHLSHEHRIGLRSGERWLKCVCGQIMTTTKMITSHFPLGVGKCAKDKVTYCYRNLSHGNGSTESTEQREDEEEEEEEEVTVLSATVQIDDQEIITLDDDDDDDQKENDDVIRDGTVISKRRRCPQCAKAHSGALELLAHMKEQHALTLRHCTGALECDCGSEFYWDYEVRGHLSASQCTGESMTFKYSKARGIDIRKAEADKKQATLKARDLLANSKQDDGVKRSEAMRCTRCKEILSTPFDLVTHLRLTHKTTIEEESVWFECIACKKTIRTYKQFCFRFHSDKCGQPLFLCAHAVIGGRRESRARSRCPK